MRSKTAKEIRRMAEQVAPDKKTRYREVEIPGGTRIELVPTCVRGVYQKLKRTVKDAKQY